MLWCYDAYTRGWYQKEGDWLPLPGKAVLTIKAFCCRLYIHLQYVCIYVCINMYILFIYTIECVYVYMNYLRILMSILLLLENTKCGVYIWVRMWSMWNSYSMFLLHSTLICTKIFANQFHYKIWNKVMNIEWLSLNLYLILFLIR